MRLRVLLASLLAWACGGAPGGGEAADAASAPAALAQGDETTLADPAVRAIDTFIASRNLQRDEEHWRIRVPRPPKATFDPDAEYVWRLETSKGPIRIRLLPDVAPMHVSSTIYLTRAGFYDGLTFHRIIRGFMAQGGCPLGSGSGGPGYQYDGELVAGVRHDGPGVVSMAHAGPGTDGSQFFITFGATPNLDGVHTVFGRVVEGMDTVRALEEVGTEGGTPTETVTIQSATIEVREAAE